MKSNKIKTGFVVKFSQLLMKLPLTVILALGGFIGWMTWKIPNKRKKIATRNIELCFPELSKLEHKNLVKDNLISTGKGLTETMLSYWAKTDKFIGIYKFSGLEHIENALEQGQGCILLGMHCHSIELNIRAINEKLSKKGHMLVRQHNNKVYEAHVDHARTNHCGKTIDKKNLKELFISLKNNNPVFYMPDQNFSYKFMYIDFFKQPAATVIGPSLLAQSCSSPIIPWFGFRRKDEKGQLYWQITVQKPMNYLKHDEAKIGLTKMNKMFEQQIRMFPDQYLWAHRRFKNHPNGTNYIYKDI